VYPKSSLLARLFGADAKTVHKHIWGKPPEIFIEAIANLQPFVVRELVVVVLLLL